MTPNRQLKQAREAHGWSHAKVAKEVGTDATTVSRWERGLFSPTPYFREQLCTLFAKDAKALGLLEPTQLSPEKAEKLQKLTKIYNAANAGTAMLATTPNEVLSAQTQGERSSTRWEQAYVQELQKQSTGVEPLKNINKSVFEFIKHSNAGIIDSLKLTPVPLSALNLPTQALASDSVQKTQKKPFKHIALFGSVALLLVLLLSGGILFIKFAPHSSPHGIVSVYPTVSVPHRIAHAPVSTATPMLSPTVAPPTPTTAPIQPPAPAILPATVAPAVTVAPTPTTPPTPFATVTPIIPGGGVIVASLFPTALTPQNCVAEARRYRCTVTLVVTDGPQKDFTWQASASGFPAAFSPNGGNGLLSHSIQVITYIYAQCQQGGQVAFVFHSALSIGITSVPWTC